MTSIPSRRSETGCAGSSGFTRSGALAFPEVTKPIFDEITEQYGTNVKPVFAQ